MHPVRAVQCTISAVDTLRGRALPCAAEAPEAMDDRRITPLFLTLIAGCAGGEVDPREGPDAAARPDVADVAVQHDAPRDAAVPEASAPEDVPAPPPDAAPPRDGAVCSGNRDGVVERSEMAFLTGASVLYAVNRAGTVVEPVDTAGAAGASGRVWNFSAAVAQDQRVLDEVLSPRGQWWSSRYPDATFAAVADRATNLLGVYRVSDAALELLGTVSAEMNRTDLRFTPPVAVLRFPLRVGASWDQTVNGNGFVNFTPLANVNRYTTRVDADGEVWTPAGRFRALRVRSDLDQSIPLTVFRVTRRTYTFLAECWGVVARVTSVDNEAAEEFRRASEYRRLGL